MFCRYYHILELLAWLENRLTDLCQMIQLNVSEVLIEEIMTLMSRDAGFKIWYQIGSYIQLTITDNDRV